MARGVPSTLLVSHARPVATAILLSYNSLSAVVHAVNCSRATSFVTVACSWWATHHQSRILFHPDEGDYFLISLCQFSTRISGAALSKAQFNTRKRPSPVTSYPAPLMLGIEVV